MAGEDGKITASFVIPLVFGLVIAPLCFISFFVQFNRISRTIKEMLQVLETIQERFSKQKISNEILQRIADKYNLKSVLSGIGAIEENEEHFKEHLAQLTEELGKGGKRTAEPPKPPPAVPADIIPLTTEAEYNQEEGKLVPREKEALDPHYQTMAGVESGVFGQTGPGREVNAQDPAYLTLAGIQSRVFEGDRKGDVNPQDPLYQTMAGVESGIFEGKKPGGVDPTDPMYQTLAGVESRVFEGKDKEPLDPMYQTLVGVQSKIFDEERKQEEMKDAHDPQYQTMAGINEAIWK